MVLAVVVLAVSVRIAEIGNVRVAAEVKIEEPGEVEVKIWILVRGIASVQEVFQRLLLLKRGQVDNFLLGDVEKEVLVQRGSFEA